MTKQHDHYIDATMYFFEGMKWREWFNSLPLWKRLLYRIWWKIKRFTNYVRIQKETTK